MMSGSSTWSTRAQWGSRRRGGTAAASQRAPSARATLLGRRTQSTVARCGSPRRARGVTPSQKAHRGEVRNRISLRFPKYCKEERLSTWSYKRVCIACDRTVYMGDDAVSSRQKVYHGNCLRCNRCHAPLQAREYEFHAGQLWCMPHYEQAVLSTYSGSQREGSRLARSSMSTYSGSQREGSRLVRSSISTHSGSQREGSRLDRDKSKRQVNNKFAPNCVNGSPAPSSKRVGGASSSTVQRLLSKLSTMLMAA